MRACGRIRFALGLGVLAFTATGCGTLTIRTWLKLAADSVGTITIGGPPEQPLSRIQGGFLIRAEIDTTTLPGPVHGTVTIEDARVALQGPQVVGDVCLWRDPSKASDGTVTLDLNGGSGSSTLTLNLLATTQLSNNLGLPPVGISQTEALPLTGVSLAGFLAAAASGSADGLLATSVTFEGTTSLGGIPVTFTLTSDLDNDGVPPRIDADLGGFCAPFFAQQATGLFYSVNSKSSYLQARLLDVPQDPLIVPLADVGAAAGDTLRITRIGTFADTLILADGNQTEVTAVFSSSNTVLAPEFRRRVPGAIAAGPRVFTPSDIPEDFRVDPAATVTVPPGAQFLIVAPLPRSGLWNDDSGFGLGVNVAVTP